jgi:hypothetical protein
MNLPLLHHAGNVQSMPISTSYTTFADLHTDAVSANLLPTIPAVSASDALSTSVNIMAKKRIRAGVLERSKKASFQDLPICFYFNKITGCNRPKYGIGCRRGNGRNYAHRCNFPLSESTVCLGNHCREKKH